MPVAARAYWKTTGEMVVPLTLPAKEAVAAQPADCGPKFTTNTAMMMPKKM